MPKIKSSFTLKIISEKTLSELNLRLTKYVLENQFDEFSKTFNSLSPKPIENNTDNYWLHSFFQ